MNRLILSKYLKFKPNKKKDMVYAFISYIILTLILTYPAILKINTHIIGHGDATGEVGFLWWFDKAIFALGVNPLHNTYIFHPLGADVNDCVFIGLALAPLTHLFGAVVSYNTYVLLTFVLSGFGMYLLVKYLTNDMYASFIAGVVYAFSPVHFAHALGHLHILSNQWIPFYVLFLMKMVRDKNKVDTYLCAIFFSLTAITSWTMGVFALVFSVIYLSYIFLTDRKTLILSDFFKKVALFGLIAAILIIPFGMVIIKNMITNPLMIKSLSEKIIYSADIFGFLIPAPFHPIFGAYTLPVYKHFTGNFSENTVYIGYTVLLFAIYAVWKKKNEIVRIFAISTLIFLILSLGPVLHVHGQWQVTGHNLTIMLPGILMHYCPILSMIRCPSRIDIMVMFSLAVLVGFGVAELLKKINNINKKRIVAFVICTFIVFEFLYALPMSKADAPDFYYQISKDKEDYAILELPIGYSPPAVHHTPLYGFYQSIHGKRLVGGALSREGVYFREFIRNTPCLKDLWQFKIDKKGDILVQNTTRMSQSILNYYNIRYIVVHYNLMRNGEYRNNANIVLSEIFGEPYLIDNSIKRDPIIVYKADHDEQFIPFMTLGDGWHGGELWSGIPSRWMKNNGVVKIVSERSMDAKLSFTAVPFYKPRSLQIFVNGEFVDTFQVNETKNITTQTISLLPCENQVLFYVPEGTDKPSELIGTKDERNLSIAFQNIKLIY